MAITLDGYFSPLIAEDKDQNLWSPMIGFAIADPSKPNSLTVLESGLVALIDTGADYCCIDNDVAKKLGLPMLGKAKQNTANATSDSDVYSVQFLVGGYFKLTMVCLGTSLRKRGSLFDAILGMDALRFFEVALQKSPPQVSLRRASP